MKTITACITNKCNLKCKKSIGGYDCVAGCASPLVNIKTEIDFNSLTKWLNKYTPNCAVHISGGEPILHNYIRSGIDMLLTNGFDVTMFSNATMLKQYPWVYDLPIKWHVTHHQWSQTVESFFENINRLNKDKTIINAIFPERPSKEIYDNYIGWKFYPSKINGTYFDFSGEEITGIPNETIELVGIDGRIHTCSNNKRSVGNIYDLSYDYDKVNNWKCYACKFPDKCQAALTAQLMQTI